jgi:hypothetical protein
MGGTFWWYEDHTFDVDNLGIFRLRMMRGRNCAGLFRDKETRFSLSVVYRARF